MTREEFIKKYELNISIDGKIIKLFDEKAEEYGKLVEQHRKLGDLIQFWLEERDNNKDIFYVIDTFATEQEHNEYYKEIRSHIKKLIENHIIENDLDQWVLNLKKNDYERYKFVINEENVQEVLKNIYKKIFDEHRKTGDLIDYLWELSEEFNLHFECADFESCFASKDSLEGILLSLLNKEEKAELGFVCDLDRNLLATGVRGYNLRIESIIKLSQSPKDSVEYKRYQKIRSKITKAEILEKLDKSIAKTILISRLKKIGIIAGAALILVLIGTFAINRAVTKNARMAKKEAQRIERVKVKKQKILKKPKPMTYSNLKNFLQRKFLSRNFLFKQQSLRCMLLRQ